MKLERRSGMINRYFERKLDKPSFDMFPTVQTVYLTRCPLDSVWCTRDSRLKRAQTRLGRCSEKSTKMASEKCGESAQKDLVFILPRLASVRRSIQLLKQLASALVVLATEPLTTITNGLQRLSFRELVFSQILYVFHEHMWCMAWVTGQQIGTLRSCLVVFS